MPRPRLAFRRPRLRGLVFAACLCGGGIGVAPTASAGGPTVDAATRAAVVDHVIETMSARYVFPDVAARVGSARREPDRRQTFETDDASVFAARLTSALQSLTQDRHLRVAYSIEPVPDAPNDGRPTGAEAVRERARAAARNHGIERVERLPGNIGYVELRAFEPAPWAGEAIAAAMTLVAHTDALIVDLRRNGGGDPATVALASSYLFDERTHLNDLYDRPLDRTTPYWTHDWVPGARFGSTRPVYVLTSARTFSGAEEFAYNLQQLHRATLIGETTGGGAHPGEFRRVGDHFRMFVSTGRAINPVSGTNWERSGVAPDIRVRADDALRVAQLQALPAIRDRAADPALREALQRRIAELETAH